MKISVVEELSGAGFIGDPRRQIQTPNLKSASIQSSPTPAWNGLHQNSAGSINGLQIKNVNSAATGRSSSSRPFQITWCIAPTGCSRADAPGASHVINFQMPVAVVAGV
jgi:hypothetical protein